MKPYEEDVNGTIIGDVTFPYEFWYTYPEGHVLAGKKDRVARNFFVNDEEAKSWFKEHYQDYYRQGVEMRVFDVT